MFGKSRASEAIAALAEGEPVEQIAPLAFTADEIEAARPSQWDKDGGLYFGYSTDDPADAAHILRGAWGLSGYQTRYQSDRHVLTIGPNGSGKSRRLLLANLCYLKNWSIVAVDPKGELFAHTAVERSRTKGHKIVLIDPFAVVKGTYPHLAARFPNLCESSGFNPVGALDPASPRFVDDAKALAVALIKTDGAKEQYWALAAQALLKGLIMGVRLEHGEAASLGLVRTILGATPSLLAKMLARMVAMFGEQCPPLAASLSEFLDYSPEDRELGGIRRQAKVQTDWLDSAPMVKDLMKGAFDFASIKQTPTTIYLVLPPEYLASHGTWLRLMVTAILRPLLREVAATGADALPVPVLFMLDEFAQLGHMEIIKDNYAMMRGYGVKLWTVWQDLNQAKMLYDDWWESLVSNAGMTQAFAPQDMTTREYLSKLGGERLTWHTRQSESGGASWSKGGLSFNSGGASNDTHIQEPIMYPHELAEMKQGQSVLFTQRGQVLRSYLPDASKIPDVSRMMAEAAENIAPRAKTI